MRKGRLKTYRLNTLIRLTICRYMEVLVELEPVFELSCSLGQVKFRILEAIVNSYIRVFKRPYYFSVFNLYLTLNTPNLNYNGI